jgi:hypothetical protein
MKIVTLIARILLGLVFVVFGLKWLFEFSQHWACTYRTGRTVPRRADSFSLLLGCGSAPNCRWRAIAGEPICTARVGAAWADHREHHLFSRVHESNESSPGGGGNNLVVHCFLSRSTTLLRNICAEGVITS